MLGSTLYFDEFSSYPDLTPHSSMYDDHTSQTVSSSQGVTSPQDSPPIVKPGYYALHHFHHLFTIGSEVHPDPHLLSSPDAYLEKAVASIVFPLMSTLQRSKNDAIYVITEYPSVEEQHEWDSDPSALQQLSTVSTTTCRSDGWLPVRLDLFHTPTSLSDDMDPYDLNVIGGVLMPYHHAFSKLFQMSLYLKHTQALGLSHLQMNTPQSQRHVWFSPHGLPSKGLIDSIVQVMTYQPNEPTTAPLDTEADIQHPHHISSHGSTNTNTSIQQQSLSSSSPGSRRPHGSTYRSLSYDDDDDHHHNSYMNSHPGTKIPMHPYLQPHCIEGAVLDDTHGCSRDTASHHALCHVINHSRLGDDSFSLCLEHVRQILVSKSFLSSYIRQNHSYCHPLHDQHHFLSERSSHHHEQVTTGSQPNSPQQQFGLVVQLWHHADTSKAPNGTNIPPQHACNCELVAEYPVTLTGLAPAEQQQWKGLIVSTLQQMLMNENHPKERSHPIAENIMDIFSSVPQYAHSAAREEVEGQSDGTTTSNSNPNRQDLTQRQQDADPSKSRDEAVDITTSYALSQILALLPQYISQTCMQLAAHYTDGYFTMTVGDTTINSPENEQPPHPLSSQMSSSLYDSGSIARNPPAVTHTTICDIAIPATHRVLSTSSYATSPLTSSGAPPPPFYPAQHRRTQIAMKKTTLQLTIDSHNYSTAHKYPHSSDHYQHTHHPHPSRRSMRADYAKHTAQISQSLSHEQFIEQLNDYIISKTHENQLNSGWSSLSLPYINTFAYQSKISCDDFLSILIRNGIILDPVVLSPSMLHDAVLSYATTLFSQQQRSPSMKYLTQHYTQLQLLHISRGLLLLLQSHEDPSGQNSDNITQSISRSIKHLGRGKIEKHASLLASLAFPLHPLVGYISRVLWHSPRKETDGLGSSSDGSISDTTIIVPSTDHQSNTTRMMNEDQHDLVVVDIDSGSIIHGDAPDAMVRVDSQQHPQSPIYQHDAMDHHHLNTHDGDEGLSDASSAPEPLPEFFDLELFDSDEFSNLSIDIDSMILGDVRDQTMAFDPKSPLSAKELYDHALHLSLNYSSDDDDNHNYL